MHIVHGRLRHPQSQGLIESANTILTDSLGISLYHFLLIVFLLKFIEDIVFEKF